MTYFNDVVDFVEISFGLGIESEQTANVLFIRIPSIDNVSLANYIRKEYTELKITTKEVEGYKISTDGWVKVECGS